MPRGGGPRPGAGRPKGRQNNATAFQRKTIAELAREYTGDAVKRLWHIAQHGDTSASQVSAINALLDRGYGKPVQGMEIGGPGGGPMLQRVQVEFIAPVDEDEPEAGDVGT